MEQAEQSEPKRARQKWPWLLAVVGLVGIGWAGVAWNVSQDEFAFLNDLHPRRVGAAGLADLNAYTLIFPRDTAPKVLPRLRRELLRRNWTQADVSDRARQAIFFQQIQADDRRTGLWYFFSIPGAPKVAPWLMEEGECEVDVVSKTTWLQRSVETIKARLHRLL